MTLQGVLNMNLDNYGENAEFWPEMPKSTKKRMSAKKQELLDLLVGCRHLHTAQAIADHLGCPFKTVERWRLGNALPKEWVCVLILQKLKNFC